ncbi:MAG: ATP-dependent helicase, partial [Anaerolineae bacterium]
NGNGRHSSLEQQLLTQTLATARRQSVPYKRELDSLDRQDFLDYVGRCKGRLLYADLGHVQIPEAAFEIAGQAVDPSEQLTWYLDLYRLYEAVRLRQGVVTFADMLMTGWEALVTFPDVCERVQQRYRAVLVDEYQDINLAQSEILHLITRAHDNYMAIGDDDQTIYEWRGASPHFILQFPKRYNAATYLISDNFRCPAAPLVLANRVIEKNRQRQPKRLSLTRGFVGETAVSIDTDLNQMSRHIVSRMRRLHKAGRPLNDIAVLVRLNAQTPPIEQELIAHNIPYRVSRPFYERNEIKTLIQYCRIAWIEQQLREGKRPLTNPTARHTFAEAWHNICNRPKRYVNADMRRQLLDTFNQQTQPLSITLSRKAESTPQPWLQEPLAQLADDIAWLAHNLHKPADKILRNLDIRLDYQTFLRHSSGFRQTGEGRAISVQTFITYAKGKGSLLAFMQHLRDLAQQKVGQNEAAPKDAVTLSTIHQAKGLEWPVVFIPQCNQGTIPFVPERAEASPELTAVLAEERRLFYVAITRTREQLYLHLLKKESVSRFLNEAGYRTVLD